MSNTYLFAGASSSMAIKAAELLQGLGHKVIGLSTKESNYSYDEFYQIETYAQENFPKLTEVIDGTVYFPGTINLKPFNRLSIQEFVNDYTINALGAASFVQTYLPQLKQSTKASILFLSTVAVQSGMPFHTSIAMAKGAIEGLTRALAAELAPTIRVNCIAPSLTATPLADRFINTPEKLEASEKRNPLKKVGTASEVAEAISFLLTEKSSWITGQVLAVDGGMGTLKI
jgi:3-oxoacyl-[acyl-carrier protein] reductase